MQGSLIFFCMGQAWNDPALRVKIELLRWLGPMQVWPVEGAGGSRDSLRSKDNQHSRLIKAGARY